MFSFIFYDRNTADAELEQQLQLLLLSLRIFRWVFECVQRGEGKVGGGGEELYNDANYQVIDQGVSTHSQLMQCYLSSRSAGPDPPG